MRSKFTSVVSSFLILMLVMPVLCVKAEDLGEEEHQQNGAESVSQDEQSDVKSVSSYDELVEQLADTSVKTIKLTADIDVAKTIFVNREVTIDGGNFTLKGKGSDMELTNSDGSIITAVSGGNVTLTNLNITDAKKYGVQAYNGGLVTVNNVTVENCKYGAIIVNGGTLTVQKLVMKNNGEHEGGNGIEISKGKDVTETPKVILDGSVDVLEGSQTSYVYVAENDTNLDKFDIENVEGTSDQIQIKDGKLVVVNKDNGIKYISADIKDGIEADVDEYVEPNNDIVTTTPDSGIDTNPQTGDNILIYFGVTFASLILLISCYRKIVKFNS